jgi:hypothetical protein
MPIDFCFSITEDEEIDGLDEIYIMDVWIDELEKDKSYRVYDEVNPKNFDITVSSKKEAILKAIEYAKTKGIRE